jgi:hypothetical protein
MNILQLLETKKENKMQNKLIQHVGKQNYV